MSLAALIGPDSVFELRAPKGGRRGTTSGYFDNLEQLAAAAERLSGTVPGVYHTVNPVKPALLARAANHVIERADLTTSDHDIERRLWLPIDLDPNRPAGICATAEEHELAVRRAREVVTKLKGQGWPAPLVVDSGNGVYVLVRIDLPNDDASRDLVKRCLAALAFQFDDEAVHVDQTMYNAARIIRVVGTLNCKGDSTLDRPHRLATVLHAPAVTEPVTLEMLEGLAVMVPQEPAMNGHRIHTPTGFDLERFVRDNLEVYREGAWSNGGYRWALQTCPFNSDHGEGSAYVVRLASGGISASCHHNSCTWGWADLREKFDPGSTDRREQAKATAVAAFSPALPTREISEKGEKSHWPEPPGPAAYLSLAGEIRELSDPHTEADPVAVLAQGLAAIGCAVGPAPHVMIGATRHSARIYAAIVGKSAKARKGDSSQVVRALYGDADPSWADRIRSGLSSGEGIITQVRDEVRKADGTVVDEGVPDKRLFIIEPEFARVLTVMKRQGNTVSAILRDAWDGIGRIATMTKTPMVATGVHMAVITHITVEELKREMDDTSLANGFANRFLWIAAKRSKELPMPEPLAGPAAARISQEISKRIQLAKLRDRMTFDGDARDLWVAMYGDLSRERDGMVGSILNRSEAHVMRLSLVYTLLDGASVISSRHLLAAVELVAYSERSVEFVFGDSTGDPVADAILRAFDKGPQTRTEVWDLFSRHESSSRIDKALRHLHDSGRARVTTEVTGGRPREVWAKV